MWTWLLAACLGSFLTISVPADQSPPEGRILWKFPLSSITNPKLRSFLGVYRNTSCSAPAVAKDGTICLGTFNGTFFAITPEGDEKWRFKAGLEIHSSPAIADDDTIYFGSRDRNFYALAPDGKLKWKFATGGWVDSSPAMATNGTIYFGSWDKNLYALNPNGSLKWKFATDGIVDSSPAVAADGTIYFGSHDSFFYALNPDGSLHWKSRTGGEIVSSPAIGSKGMVCFTSLDGNLYALNPDGTECWHYRSGAIPWASPILDSSGNVWTGYADHADILSPDGKRIWGRGAAFASDTSGVAVSGNFYMPVPWRSVVSVTEGDHELWQCNLRDGVSSAVTVANDGIVYICAGDTLYAVRPPDKVPPTPDGPWPMFRANAQHTGRVENQITH